jgi:hypothetical protein
VAFTKQSQGQSTSQKEQQLVGAIGGVTRTVHNRRDRPHVVSTCEVNQFVVNKVCDVGSLSRYADVMTATTCHITFAAAFDVINAAVADRGCGVRQLPPSPVPLIGSGGSGSRPPKQPFATVGGTLAVENPIDGVLIAHLLGNATPFSSLINTSSHNASDAFGRDERQRTKKKSKPHNRPVRG